MESTGRPSKVRQAVTRPLRQQVLGNGRGVTESQKNSHVQNGESQLVQSGMAIETVNKSARKPETSTLQPMGCQILEEQRAEQAMPEEEPEQAVPNGEGARTHSSGTARLGTLCETNMSAANTADTA